MIGAVVHRQGVFFPVQGEMAFGYPVGISAGHLSGARAVIEIAQRVLISENHIGQPPVPVRHGNSHYTGPDA